jgi:NADH:ubiquinone oxidoreductase subunit K
MGVKRLTFLWIVILLVAFKKLSNHFIALLMTLEIFSLLRILVASRLGKLTNSVRLIFILIRLRVGEAVLGLALLVKFARETSSEQTRTRLL